MRTVLCFWLLAAVPASAGGDLGDCMAKCSAKAQPCLAGCKDDKCMSKCSTQIQGCASTCDGKGVDPKLLDKAAKEQAQQQSHHPTKVTGSKR
jgi:hypothetical protein